MSWERSRDESRDSRCSSLNRLISLVEVRSAADKRLFQRRCHNPQDESRLLELILLPVFKNSRSLASNVYAHCPISLAAARRHHSSIITSPCSVSPFSNESTDDVGVRIPVSLGVSGLGGGSGALPLRSAKRLTKGMRSRRPIGRPITVVAYGCRFSRSSAHASSRWATPSSCCSTPSRRCSRSLKKVSMFAMVDAGGPLGGLMALAGYRDGI